MSDIGFICLYVFFGGRFGTRWSSGSEKYLVVIMFVSGCVVSVVVSFIFEVYFWTICKRVKRYYAECEGLDVYGVYRS